MARFWFGNTSIAGMLFLLLRWLDNMTTAEEGFSAENLNFVENSQCICFPAETRCQKRWLMIHFSYNRVPDPCLPGLFLCCDFERDAPEMGTLSTTWEVPNSKEGTTTGQQEIPMNLLYLKTAFLNKTDNFGNQVTETEEATTEEATTGEATTEKATTEEATTGEATTEEATTEEATTEEATTEEATTEEATTGEDTTEETITEEATTENVLTTDLLASTRLMENAILNMTGQIENITKGIGKNLTQRPNDTFTRVTGNITEQPQQNLLFIHERQSNITQVLEESNNEEVGKVTRVLDNNAGLENITAIEWSPKFHMISVKGNNTLEAIHINTHQRYSPGNQPAFDWLGWLGL